MTIFVLPKPDGNYRQSYGGIESSSAYTGINERFRKSIPDSTAKPSSLTPLNYFFNFLFNAPNIRIFEERVEKIRELLLNKASVFSRTDVKAFKAFTRSKSLSHLLAISRLIGPLLESSKYSQDAAEMVRFLLSSKYSEARYVALEALAYALGEVPIAEDLLLEAKEILKDEPSSFVKEYLECL